MVSSRVVSQRDEPMQPEKNGAAHVTFETKNTGTKQVVEDTKSDALIGVCHDVTVLAR